MPRQQRAQQREKGRGGSVLCGCPPGNLDPCGVQRHSTSRVEENEGFSSARLGARRRGESWAYWVYGGSLPGLRVLIGSEDKQTFTALPPLLAPTASYWIPSKHFVMDMSAGKAFVDINQGNNRLGELYAEERRATKQSARRMTAWSSNIPAATRSTCRLRTSI